MVLDVVGEVLIKRTGLVREPRFLTAFLLHDFCMLPAGPLLCVTQIEERPLKANCPILTLSYELTVG